MRTISILFLLAILGCQSSKTSNPSVLADSLVNSTASSNRQAFYKPFSEFKGDTMQYLNYNFVDHKDQYIGKTFSVLYHNLEIPVKSSIAGSDHRNALASPSLSLAFYDTDSEMYMMNSLDPVPTSYSVIINWENPVSAEDYFKLYKASNGNWNSNYEALFAGQIIKDVFVLKYVNPQKKKQ